MHTCIHKHKFIICADTDSIENLVTFVDTNHELQVFHVFVYGDFKFDIRIYDLRLIIYNSLTSGGLPPYPP